MRKSKLLIATIMSVAMVSTSIAPVYARPASAASPTYQEIYEEIAEKQKDIKALAGNMEYDFSATLKDESGDTPITMKMNADLDFVGQLEGVSKVEGNAKINFFGQEMDVPIKMYADVNQDHVIDSADAERSNGICCDRIY